MAINDNDFETCHPVQLDFAIPSAFSVVQFDFIDCLCSQIDDIDEPVRNTPLGSNIVFEFTELMKHRSYEDND